jgi:hypothetical protein
LVAYLFCTLLRALNSDHFNLSMLVTCGFFLLGFISISITLNFYWYRMFSVLFSSTPLLLFSF